ncbi:hypothetical protein CWC38_10230 [Kocuria tytonicola]|nr:hypothetical protein CWC38_10230 [Kocuria tytonicola]
MSDAMRVQFLEWRVAELERQVAALAAHVSANDAESSDAHPPRRISVSLLRWLWLGVSLLLRVWVPDVDLPWER